MKGFLATQILEDSTNVSKSASRIQNNFRLNSNTLIRLEADGTSFHIDRYSYDSNGTQTYIGRSNGATLPLSFSNSSTEYIQLLDDSYFLLVKREGGVGSNSVMVVHLKSDNTIEYGTPVALSTRSAFGRGVKISQDEVFLFGSNRWYSGSTTAHNTVVHKLTINTDLSIDHPTYPELVNSGYTEKSLINGVYNPETKIITAFLDKTKDVTTIDVGDPENIALSEKIAHAGVNVNFGYLDTAIIDKDGTVTLNNGSTTSNYFEVFSTTGLGTQTHLSSTLLGDNFSTIHYVGETGFITSDHVRELEVTDTGVVTIGDIDEYAMVSGYIAAGRYVDLVDFHNDRILGTGRLTTIELGGAEFFEIKVSKGYSPTGSATKTHVFVCNINSIKISNKVGTFPAGTTANFQIEDDDGAGGLTRITLPDDTYYSLTNGRSSVTLKLVLSTNDNTVTPQLDSYRVDVRWIDPIV